MDQNKVNWISKTAKRFVKSGGHEEDLSLSKLKELEENGYDTIKLIVPENACDKCQEAVKAVKVRDLSTWLGELEHDAPLFEWTHPDDGSCYLLVSDSSGTLESMIVTKDGSSQAA